MTPGIFMILLTAAGANASWGERGKSATILAALLLAIWIVASSRQRKVDAFEATKDFEADAAVFAPQHPANRLTMTSRQVS